MNRVALKTLSCMGVIAPIWLLVGVLIASHYYAGYSHYDQELSELGAIGSPTEKLSPLINNYPLSLLFICFGVSVSRVFAGSRAAQTSGYLIVVHGVGTFFAGYFPCDFECPKDSASLNQILHGIAGLSMFLGLTAANFIWAFVPSGVSGLRWFRWLSLTLALVSIAFVFPMIGAINADHATGLYQRLNYGVSSVWLLVLAWVTLRQLSTGNLKLASVVTRSPGAEQTVNKIASKLSADL